MSQDNETGHDYRSMNCVADDEGWWLGQSLATIAILVRTDDEARRCPGTAQV